MLLVNKLKKHQIFAFIFLYIKKYFKLEIFAILIAFFVLVLSILPPKFVAFLINNIASSSYLDLMKVFIELICIIILTTSMNYIMEKIYSKIKNNIIYDIRSDIFSSAIKSDYAAFSHTEMGKIYTKLMTDVKNISELFGFDSVKIFINFFKIVFIYFIIFALNKTVSFFVIMELVPLACLCIYYYPKTKKSTLSIQEQSDKVYNEINTYLSGIKTVKYLTMENESIIKLKNSFFKLKDLNYKNNHLDIQTKAISIFFIIYGLIAVWVIGGLQVYRNELSLGNLIAIWLYVDMLVQPVSELINVNSLFSKAIISLNRIIQFKKDINKYDKITTSSNQHIVGGNINISNVNFSYGNKTLFKDFSLEIKENTFNAIVGKSGIGKSTLAYLLINSIQPDSGNIYINNLCIKDISNYNLRKSIFFVDSQPFIFGSSLREALMLPDDKSLDEKAIACLSELKLGELSIEMATNSGFLDIGVNADTLSHGQKHRLAIVRALLKKPKFIIIDEALSFLDIYTEMDVVKTLNKFKKDLTIMLITHSLNFINYFDQVILLYNDKDECVKYKLFEKPEREFIVNQMLTIANHG
jgi:ABC-type bacteriocin/lantibiotic exporter with double-glycine peptidase domain